MVCRWDGVETICSISIFFLVLYFILFRWFLLARLSDRGKWFLLAYTGRLFIRAYLLNVLSIKKKLLITAMNQGLGKWQETLDVSFVAECHCHCVRICRKERWIKQFTKEEEGTIIARTLII